MCRHNRLIFLSWAGSMRCDHWLHPSMLAEDLDKDRGGGVGGKEDLDRDQEEHRGPRQRPGRVDTT